MKHKRKQTPRIKEVDLIGKYQCLGFCFPDGRIEIDPRQKAFDYLDTLIHEHLHFCFPKLKESKVSWAAGVITKAVWKKQYRRIAK